MLFSFYPLLKGNGELRSDISIHVAKHGRDEGVNVLSGSGLQDQQEPELDQVETGDPGRGALYVVGEIRGCLWNPQARASVTRPDSVLSSYFC